MKLSIAGRLLVGALLTCAATACTLWPSASSFTLTLPSGNVFTQSIVAIPYTFSAPTNPANCQYILAVIPPGVTPNPINAVGTLPGNVQVLEQVSRLMPSNGVLSINLNDITSKLSRGAVDGNYYLVFGVTGSNTQNQYGFISSLTQGFQLSVQTGAPFIEAIEPVLPNQETNFLANAGVNQLETTTYDIEGWNLQPTTTAIFTPATVSATFTGPSSGSTTATLVVTGSSLSAGTTSLSVQLVNGSQTPLPALVMPVAAGLPTLTSLSPDSLTIGSSGQIISISGTNFTSVSVVTLQSSNGSLSSAPVNGNTPSIVVLDETSTLLTVSIDLSVSNGSGPGTQVTPGTATLGVDNFDGSTPPTPESLTIY